MRQSNYVKPVGRFNTTEIGYCHDTRQIFERMDNEWLPCHRKLPENLGDEPACIDIMRHFVLIKQITT